VFYFSILLPFRAGHGSVLKHNPEPVPPAWQLAVLPFLAAVDGYLREEGVVSGLRITVHRAMSREGQGICNRFAHICEREAVIGVIFHRCGPPLAWPIKQLS